MRAVAENKRIVPALSFSCLVALLSVWASPATAEVIGLSARYDELIELHLSSGDGDVLDGERWTVSDLVFIHAVEWDGGDTAYVAGSLAISASALYSVDLQSGAVTDLAPVSLSADVHLSLADDGSLWMSRADELYSYDPESGILTLETTMAVVDAQGIAWWNDTLYILVPGTDPSEAPMLGEVNPNDGTVSVLTELSALAPPEPYFRFFGSIDFDRDGGLWLGFVDQNIISDPPVPSGGTAYVAAPFGSGNAVIRALADGSYWPRNPMAVSGGFDVVEVPSLGSRELSVFAAVLGLLAIVVLRRGRSLIHDESAG